MSLLEKSSVYEQPSVYKQGGGGGGSFIVPQYLQAVEYIDNSSFTGRLNLSGKCQFEIKQSYRIVLEVAGDWTKTNSSIVYVNQAQAGNWSNGYIEGMIKGNANYLGITVNNQNPSVNVSNFTIGDKVKLEYRGPVKTLIATDEHGHTTSTTDTHTINNGIKLTSWSVFGDPVQGSTTTFKGRFYKFSIFDTSTDEWIMYLVPARHKETGKAMILDCISGNVGSNWTTSFDETGVIYGHDLPNVVIQ